MTCCRSTTRCAMRRNAPSPAPDVRRLFGRGDPTWMRLNRKRATTWGRPYTIAEHISADFMTHTVFFFKQKTAYEIIELDPEVQYETRRVADRWADKQAQSNPWFKKVLESQ